MRHNHPILRRHHVEPLGGVLADHRHHATATGAGGVLWQQGDLDPRKVQRQRATVGTSLRRALHLQSRITLLRLGLVPGGRLLEVLEPQLSAVRR